MVEREAAEKEGGGFVYANMENGRRRGEWDPRRLLTMVGTGG